MYTLYSEYRVAQNWWPFVSVHSYELFSWIFVDKSQHLSLRQYSANWASVFMVDRTFSYLCLMLPYYEKRLSQKIWNCHCFKILNINIFFDDHRQHHYRRHHHHYRCHHHHHHQGIAWQQTLLPRMPEAIFAVDWHHSAGFRSIFHQICKYVTKLICIETLSLVHYWLLSCLVKHTSNTTFQDCSMFVNKSF